MANKGRWFIFVGAPLIAGNLVALVCSCSTDASSPLPATPDSGHPSTTHTGTDSGSDPGAPTNTPPPVTDAGADCGKEPTLHPPKDGGGVFCPFSATDGGKDLYCAANDQCCETPSSAAPSTCEPRGNKCPVANSTVWECEDPGDCPPSDRCCAVGSNGGAVTLHQDQCGPYLSKFAGTRCAKSCAAGELVVCEKTSECAAGQCTPVRSKGNQFGVCN